MRRVRLTDYGLEVVLGGTLDRAQAEELLAELTEKVPAHGCFDLLVDTRRARAFSGITLDVLKRGSTLLQERGLRRRAVIVTSAIVTLQHQRLARDTGSLHRTRYINATHRRDWHQAALDWLLHGVDPDPSPS